MNQNDQMRDKAAFLEARRREALGTTASWFHAGVKAAEDWQALNHTPDTGKMVEPSEQAKHTLANPPESIYLQVGDAEAEFPGEIHWSAVTWCDEPVLRSDLMYIRSDLTRPRKLVRLTESELLKAFTTSEGRKLSFEHERQWFLMCSKIVMDAMQRINGGDQCAF